MYVAKDNAFKEPSDALFKDSALKKTYTCRKDNALKVLSDTVL